MLILISVCCTSCLELLLSSDSILYEAITWDENSSNDRLNEKTLNSFDGQYDLKDSFSIYCENKFADEPYTISNLLNPGQIFVFDKNDNLISYVSYDPFESYDKSYDNIFATFPPKSNVDISRMSKEFGISDILTNLTLVERTKYRDNLSYYIYVFHNDRSRNSPFKIRKEFLRMIRNKRSSIEFNLVDSSILNPSFSN